MQSLWKKGIAAALAVAAVTVVIALIAANRPLVKAPLGTVALDNDLDTSDVIHLVVDDAEVLSEKTEQIIAICNANWRVMAGRVMAVVTVASVENAEDAAWDWMERLSLGSNDALLLIETQNKKDCVIVSRGSFLEDLSAQRNGFVDSLTYLPIHAGEFDNAALAVFERTHYFYGYDDSTAGKQLAGEGRIVLAVLAVIFLPIIFHLVAEKVDNFRFRRWYNRYGLLEQHAVPWRTVFFWHRAGSKWYQLRMSGEWVDYGSVIRRRRREVGAHMRGRFRR